MASDDEPMNEEVTVVEQEAFLDAGYGLVLHNRWQVTRAFSSQQTEE